MESESTDSEGEGDGGDGGARAAHLLEEQGADSSTQLGIVDAAAGEIQAGELPDLARNPGLVITPDQPVVIDALSKRSDKRRNNKNHWGGGNTLPHDPAPASSSSDLWPSAVGVDQLWPQLNASRSAAPTIAFVDSGIDASRSDFAGRVLAQVKMTKLSGNSPGDGSGHGTLVAGLAAGSAAGHTGAAPKAGIVSIDVMNDDGMARTSDVIAAAQWILKNRTQYNIRVANFSLHSAAKSSFRWDPLDKAIEKLWTSGVVVVTAAGNDGKGTSERIKYAPGNDPFAITVGAIDLHNSPDPARADMAPWSAWGYTYDGFAKPELSAPGRSLVGPVPANSALAQERPGQVVNTPNGTYIRLSGTSLSAPIVSGIAADLLMLNPRLSPDQVKGALMLSARSLPRVRTIAAGVGEVYASGAANVSSPPNPNRGLNAFLVPDPTGPGVVFDDGRWLQTVKATPSWDDVSWLDGWSNTAWSLVSWSDVSWSDVSWLDVSWSDVSWDDVSWDDVSWADVLDDGPYGDVIG